MPTRYLPTLITTLALWLPASLEASTFHCEAEDVACLIAAIHTSNTNGAPENTIRLAPGTYTLTAVDNTTQGPNGLPAITSALTIRADIDGSEVRIVRPTTAPPFRFLYAGSGAKLTLDGITLTGGEGGGGTGGALYSAGAEVTLAHATVVGNQAQTVGAIDSVNGTLRLSDTRINDNRFGNDAVRTQGGTVTVVRSEFARNHAGGPFAGLRVLAPELLWMEDTRFANNDALLGTGGLLLQGGTAVLLRMTFERNRVEMGTGASAVIILDATVILRDSTFLENMTDADGATLRTSGTSTVDIINSTFAGNFPLSGSNSASVITNLGPSVATVVNSTFAGNRSVSAVFLGNVNVQNTIVHHTVNPSGGDCTGQVLSLGHNLFDGAGATCGMVLHPTDVIGAAGLGTFTDTGAPGGGHVPLLAESVAINAAEASACPPTDQLGRSRSRPCDIGAVEYAGVNDLVTASPLSSTFSTTSDVSGCPAGFSGTLRFTARVASNPGSPVLEELQLQVTSLTNGNLLQNADHGPGGAGALLTIPRSGQYADGVLAPGESVDVPVAVCLRDRSPFTFFVNVLGNRP